MLASADFRRHLPDGAIVDHWTAADGWPLRRFDWPADSETPRGTLFFQGGRGDIFEKYLELFAHWHQQGWSIISLDWRGQGGSGRLSPDPRVGHIRRFATFIDDYRAFWASQAPEVPGPRVLMGHSMGGHLVLRAMVEAAVRPDAAVLIAPMLGLESPLGARGGRWFARAMVWLGNPARAAWKTNERPISPSPRQVLLTHDVDRYADELWWRDQKPELAGGPPSWQWLAEAFASTAAVRADPRLATLDVPTLMLVADADKLVDPVAARAVAARLPDCTLVGFGGESAHEILREVDPIRDRAIGAIDTFLDERVPA
ncbi:alpha/beta fold hydrolase [Hephaestia sp. GCM10023244]|uniref:alpha/beta fold hydrolase n=1 Tax=unclassified Hephaestia TaxID=2631281 RepID=UPI002077617A|nr:alpha/beta hydrolase [Hephaestia sp. MAHUQ-44]MCM8729436.1 alpha/beta hydrolase [Hephaestia sp. MAHUQ-44]